MDVLTDLLNSKKFIAMLAGVIVAFVAKLGIQMDTEAVLTILSPIMTYIVGQGIADHGKAAAIIHTDNGS